MADPNDEAIKLGQITSEKVFRRQQIFFPLLELAAAQVTPETTFGVIPYDCKLEAVLLVVNDLVLAAAAVNATFTFAKHPGGVLHVFTPSADLVPFTPIDLGFPETLAATGDVLTFQIAKAGGGVLLPSGQLVLTYRQTLPRDTFSGCSATSKIRQMLETFPSPSI